MIFYRTSRLLKEAVRRHPLLVEVIRDLDGIAETLDWKRVITTSIYRTLAENKAVGAKSLVHCTVPHRSQDIGTKAVAPETEQAVADKINQRWVYDPTRPHYVVAYCRPHGTGRHIHVQVHPNTRRRT